MTLPCGMASWTCRSSLTCDAVDAANCMLNVDGGILDSHCVSKICFGGA